MLAETRLEEASGAWIGPGAYSYLDQAAETGGSMPGLVQAELAGVGRKALDPDSETAVAAAAYRIVGGLADRVAQRTCPGS